MSSRLISRGDGELAYPSLVVYKTPAEYRSHFDRVYCRKPIMAFDGIEVRFRKSQFEHSFYESTMRNRVKDQFSKLRAERIDWIKAALQDPNAELYVGWDRERKRHDSSHRVTVVVNNYVVIVRLKGLREANFVTAYVANSEVTLRKIRSSPKWNAKNT